MLVILSLSYKFTCLTLPAQYCVIVRWYAFIKKEEEKNKNEKNEKMNKQTNKKYKNE